MTTWEMLTGRRPRLNRRTGQPPRRAMDMLRGRAAAPADAHIGACDLCGEVDHHLEDGMCVECRARMTPPSEDAVLAFRARQYRRLGIQALTGATFEQFMAEPDFYIGRCGPGVV